MSECHFSIHFLCLAHARSYLKSTTTLRKCSLKHRLRSNHSLAARERSSSSICCSLAARMQLARTFLHYVSALYCNMSVLQYTLTVVFSWIGYYIYLMNVHHGLSLSLFDEHVYNTCHTRLTVPTHEPNLNLSSIWGHQFS